MIFTLHNQGEDKNEKAMIAVSSLALAGALTGCTINVGQI
jgi:hypothetical protein